MHNFLFGDFARLSIKGFGRNADGEFQIIVEQPFIKGTFLSNEEIEEFASKMGFDLINRKNWTYSTQDYYLSDLHDENVIKTPEGNIVVIDAEIRLNFP